MERFRPLQSSLCTDVAKGSAACAEACDSYQRFARTGDAFNKTAIFFSTWKSLDTSAIAAAAFASCRSVVVKSFGRRQAYESPRGRNPRATGDGYGDFDFRQMSAMARPPLGSAGVDADRPLRCASARYCRSGMRFGVALSTSIVTMGARGSVAGGEAPAAEGSTMPCRVIACCSRSLGNRVAVHAVASTVRTSR